MDLYPRRLALVTPLLLALVLVTPAASPGPAPADSLERGATGLSLALRQVGVSGRVLMITAHPDDEHNGVLVRLARGLGLRTAFLTLTRGEGGQNAIGPELFEALGVLRTQELMAVHRVDGVEQYFGRAYDFGYSFSVDETFAKWGREDTLGDLVRVVRAFRPDVILTLPLEAPGGGMHHQAVARLARDAFRAAADPARFPSQLSPQRRPWQALRIYQGGTPGGYPQEIEGEPVSVPTGVYDPLLGLTWQQLGSLARRLHRCQDVAQLMTSPGPASGVYYLVDSEPPLAGGGSDVLEGIDTSLVGLSRFASGPDLEGALRKLQARADAARAGFDPEDPGKVAPSLAGGLVALRRLLSELPRLVPDEVPRAEIEARLRDEESDLVRALHLARGVSVEARVGDGLVTPGQEFDVEVSVWNQGAYPLETDAARLQVPPGWTARLEGALAPVVEPGSSQRLRFTVRVADDAAASRPYWRREDDPDRYAVTVPDAETLPWTPPLVVAALDLHLADLATSVSATALYHYPGPFVGGEKAHDVQVVPALAVRVSPEQAVVRTGREPAPLEIHAFVRHNEPGAGEATVRLEAPAGWSVDPASVPLRFAYEGEEVAARFRVSPPPRLPGGSFTVRAIASRSGRDFSERIQEVAYDHIERRQLVWPATAAVLALDVKVSAVARVGYVMGAGDALADAIGRLGVPVTLLGSEDLAFGDLDRFTTIVTGIRAYETRADLRSLHPRLMRWVEAGGHLVVLYNRAGFNRVSLQAPQGPPGRRDEPETSPFAPYPAAVTSSRISDETAPMRVLEPGHPLLTTPNRIGPGDWEGWVQERAIQLLETRDPRYLDLLASTDPFPKNPGEKRGMLVDSAVGRGTWTYVGLVLFREVPAGVPGGWRLLANLVSRPRAE